MWLEIVKSKRIQEVVLVQLENDEGDRYCPRDGELFQSPVGSYRVKQKPGYGDWVELRVIQGELPKSWLETVGS